MAIDDITVDRVRQHLAGAEPGPIEEKRIIGDGWGFLIGGKLCCAVTTRGLTVRVGPEAKPAALAESNVIPHLVGKRETSAFVVVEPDGFAGDDDLAIWIDRGLAFVATLD